MGEWIETDQGSEREVLGTAYDPDSGLFAKGTFRCKAWRIDGERSLWYVAFERKLRKQVQIQVIDSGESKHLDRARMEADRSMGRQFTATKRAKAAERAKDAPLKALYDRNAQKGPPDAAR